MFISIKNLILQEKFWYAIVLVLLPPALLINLGMMTFIDDEAIRALVALEMKLSGSYITPTILGEYYYNKPPLYNWILLAFFELASRFDEFASRISTVTCLLGFAATVFLVFKPKYGIKIAFVNALALITCGRILLWDSMLGLIDICFSWVMFGMFMVVFHRFREGNFKKLFLGAYLLAAIGFLMKGLPSLVFLGCTLLAWFIYKKSFRALFSRWHWIGMVLLLGIIGGYYALYHQYNNLSRVLPVLLDESLKRTGVRFGWEETVLHVLSFPFEMVYHFLPWSLLIIYFIGRGWLALVRRDEFIAFNLVVFLANIIVYWISPEVYPRYLLMLTPLLFSTFFYLHWIHAEKRTRSFRIVEISFAVLLAVLVLGSIVPVFLERTQGNPFVVPKSFLLFAGSLGLVFAFRKLPENRLLIMFVALLWMRLAFNWFVLPDRLAEDWGTGCRSSSIEMGKKFKDRPLYLFGDTELQMTNAFYLTNSRQQVITREHEAVADSTACYIYHPEQYPDGPFQKIGEFKYRHGKGMLFIGVIPYDRPKK